MMGISHNFLQFLSARHKNGIDFTLSTVRLLLFEILSFTGWISMVGFLRVPFISFAKWQKVVFFVKYLHKELHRINAEYKVILQWNTGFFSYPKKNIKYTYNKEIVFLLILLHPLHVATTERHFFFLECPGLPYYFQIHSIRAQITIETQLNKMKNANTNSS